MGELNDDWTEEDTQRAMAGMGNTFRLIMNARHGTLNVPVTTEIDFTGAQAEAMGSARHIADVLRESGYDASTEYVGETTSIKSDDERHTMKIVVTQS